MPLSCHNKGGGCTRTKIRLIRKRHDARSIVRNKYQYLHPPRPAPPPPANCVPCYCRHPSDNQFTYHSISVCLDQFPIKFLPPANGTSRFYIHLGESQRLIQECVQCNRIFLNNFPLPSTVTPNPNEEMAIPTHSRA
jgi:hypothetical protein